MVRSMVSSTMQWTRRMRLSITPLPPLPLKTPQISPPWKKTHTLNPPSLLLLLLFLFPTTLSHPISTTAPLPAPGFCCTNQEQMSAGAMLKDPAVLDASHMLFIQRWRLTARLLVKPISKKKRGGKKQTLQMPSSPFKSSTYMSTPFCLLSIMHCSLLIPHHFSLFLFLFVSCGRQRGGGKKSWDVADENISSKEVFKDSSGAAHDCV